MKRPLTPEVLAVDLCDALRPVASSYFAAESNRTTLQPTVIAHHACMRSADLSAVDWENQTHFCTAATRTMRQVLLFRSRLEPKHASESADSGKYQGAKRKRERGI